MGQAIIKAAPDRDLYLIWSSVVDAAVWVGTRAELAGYAVEEYGRHGWETYWRDGLDRADDCGTSDRAFKTGAWDDESLRVGEGSPEAGRDGGIWYIRRDRLAAYADALLADDDAAGHALMEWEPWDE